ncbi:hypothetical protein JTB14_007305 [Gonioctena quinquepunctata]|nr:hypothetical protein JTB14_007305 [Gonioctena quinquepunctata]
MKSLFYFVTPEAQPDDDEDILVDDHLEILEVIDSEQEFAENEGNLLDREPAARIHCLGGTNGTTRWRKYPATVRNVLTRSENIVTHLPGPEGNIRHKNEAPEIWQYFFFLNMLEKIFTYTYKFKEIQAYDVAQNRSFRPTDLIEL